MKRILLPLCILMAVLIIVISMTTVSFSWFTPNSQAGSGLKFSSSSFVSSTDCTVTTYIGKKNVDDVIKYDDVVEGLIDFSYGDNVYNTVYFKTVISNHNEKYPANVSLYIDSFSVEAGSASLAVVLPTNTYRTYSCTLNDSGVPTGDIREYDLHIIRNAHITKKDVEVTGAGELEVEWFVKCDSGTVIFDPSSVYLMYD